MFWGLFKTTHNKISFEDVQYAIQHTEQFIIVNTLPVTDQDCLIKNTISYQMEEKCINELLNNYDFKSRKFIIYGKHAIDDSAENKYKQLLSLGFSEIYMYMGGLFEWMLLQDIYGSEEFPTTRKVLDILKFKPAKSSNSFSLL